MLNLKVNVQKLTLKYVIRWKLWKYITGILVRQHIIYKDFRDTEVFQLFSLITFSLWNKDHLFNCKFLTKINYDPFSNWQSFPDYQKTSLMIVQK